MERCQNGTREAQFVVTVNDPDAEFQARSGYSVSVNGNRATFEYRSGNWNGTNKTQERSFGYVFVPR